MLGIGHQTRHDAYQGDAVINESPVVQSGKNTATVASVSVTVSTVFLSSTDIPFIASTSTTYVEVTVGTKTAIALSVITIVYVIIVLILKYKFSIPWRRALA